MVVLALNCFLGLSSFVLVSSVQSAGATSGPGDYARGLVQVHHDLIALLVFLFGGIGLGLAIIGFLVVFFSVTELPAVLAESPRELLVRWRRRAWRKRSIGFLGVIFFFFFA